MSVISFNHFFANTNYIDSIMKYISVYSISFFICLLSNITLAFETHTNIEAHRIGVLFGWTDNAGGGEGTGGLMYQYKFNPRFGLGVGYEYTNRSFNQQGASVYYGEAYAFPIPKLRLGIGLGEQRNHGTGGQSQSLTRYSIGYEIETQLFNFIPRISYDDLDSGHSVVTGIEILGAF